MNNPNKIFKHITINNNEWAKTNKCRTCKHIHWASTAGQSKQMEIFECSFRNCSCNNFLPFDNLEYLEYRYNNQPNV